MSLFETDGRPTTTSRGDLIPIRLEDANGNSFGSGQGDSRPAKNRDQHKDEARRGDDRLRGVCVGEGPPGELEQHALHDGPQGEDAEPRREEEVRQAPLLPTEAETEAPEADDGAGRDDPEPEGDQDPMVRHGLTCARRSDHRHRTLIQTASPTATTRWRTSLTPDQSDGSEIARISVATHPPMKTENAVPKSRTRSSRFLRGVASRYRKTAKTQAKRTTVTISGSCSTATEVPPAHGPIREGEGEHDGSGHRLDLLGARPRPCDGPEDVEQAVDGECDREEQGKAGEGAVRRSQLEGEVRGRHAGDREAGETREVPGAHGRAPRGRSVTARVPRPASTNADSKMCTLRRSQFKASNRSPSMNEPNAMSA